MGIITVSIDDEVEERFRDKLEQMGNEKGKMGEAISEALENWIRENKDRKKWKDIAEEGLEMGELEFNRDELHER